MLSFLRYKKIFSSSLLLFAFSPSISLDNLNIPQSDLYPKNLYPQKTLVVVTESSKGEWFDSQNLTQKNDKNLSAVFSYKSPEENQNNLLDQKSTPLEDTDSVLESLKVVGGEIMELDKDKLPQNEEVSNSENLIIGEGQQDLLDVRVDISNSEEDEKIKEENGNEKNEGEIENENLNPINEEENIGQENKEDIKEIEVDGGAMESIIEEKVEETSVLEESVSFINKKVFVIFKNIFSFLSKVVYAESLYQDDLSKNIISPYLQVSDFEKVDVSLGEINEIYLKFDVSAPSAYGQIKIYGSNDYSNQSWQEIAFLDTENFVDGKKSLLLPKSLDNNGNLSIRIFYEGEEIFEQILISNLYLETKEKSNLLSVLVGDVLELENEKKVSLEEAKEIIFEKKNGELYFPETLENPVVITPNKKNSESLSMNIVGENFSTIKLLGESVFYEEVFENVDLEYKIEENGVKEYIYLRNSLHPESFFYDTNLDSFVVEKSDFGEIKLYSKKEKDLSGKNPKLLYTIRAPLMVDYLGQTSDKIELSFDGNVLILTPDKEWLKTAVYPVVVDPTIDIEVLNVHSHPVAGEYWDVDFTTVGEADLTITPADQATIDDDEFTSLFCGSEDRTLNTQILSGDVIFYPNWSCDEVARVSHLTLKTGNHHLVFNFANSEESVTSEAFNAALTWTGIAGDGLYSTAGNWSTTKVPSAADTITFDNTCTNCNMTIDVSTTTASFTMASTYTGVITQSNATTFVTSGAFSQSGGTFNGGTGTTTYQGNFTVSGGTYNAATSTLFSGSSGQTANINSSQSFYNFEVNKSNNSLALTSGDTFIVTAELRLTDGVLNTGTIDARGNINQASTSNGGSATVDFGDNSVAQTWTVNGGDGPGVRFDHASDANDSIVFNAAGGFYSFTTTADFSGTVPITNSGNYTITLGNNNSGSLSFAAGTFSGGSYTLTSTCIGWTISGGAFTAPSTVQFTGTCGVTLNVNSSQTFTNLIVNQTNNGVTITSGDTLVVTGTLTLTDGTLNTGTVDARGDISQASTFNGGTAVVDFGDNSVAQTWTINGGDGPGARLDNSSDANDSIVFNAAASLNSFDATSGFSGTFAFTNSGNHNVTIGNGNTGSFTVAGGTINGGPYSMYSSCSAWTISTGTFNSATTTEFIGTCGITANVNSSQTFYNLTFNQTSNGVTITSGDTLVVSNTLNLTDGSVGTGTLEARGNVTVSSTYNGGTSPLNFTGSSSSGSATQTFDLTGASALYDGDITVNKSEGEVRMLSDLTLNAASQDLTIAEGIFNLNGSNLTVNGSSGTFPVQDGGTFKFQGGETLTINSGYPSFSSSSTLEYTGSSSYTIQGYTYRNIYISGSGSFSATSGPLTIQKDFIQQAGTFTAAGATTTIAGNITRTGGTFSHNSGVVHLNGSSQTVNDSTTFNNLYKVITSTDTLTFEAGATTTVAGTMTLRGAASNILTLQTSVSNVPWYIDPQSTRSILYLDVNDSYNSNATDIIAYGVNSTDGGGNTNWIFENNAPTSGTASITDTGTNTITVMISGASDDTALATLPYVFHNVTTDFYFTATSSTYATSTGLSENTQYTFEVGVYDQYGNSATTSQVQGTTDSTPTDSSNSNNPETYPSGHNNNWQNTNVYLYYLPINNEQTTSVITWQNLPGFREEVSTDDINDEIYYQNNVIENLIEVDMAPNGIDYTDLNFFELFDSVFYALVTSLIVPVSNVLRVSLTPNFVGGIKEIVAFYTSVFNSFFTMIGIRRKRRYWGVVYDSENKQPIDPAIVSLVDLKNNEVLEEAVTDLYGRFGFLDRIGRFRILSKKTHYKFPSTKVSGSSDGVYENIYRGEEFEINKLSNIISPNIPMDRENFDWNQEAKKEYVKFHPVFDLFVLKFLDLISYGALALSMFFTIYNPSFITFFSLMVSILSIFSGRFLPPSRLWGRVIGINKDIPIVIILNPKNMPNVIMGRCRIAIDGRYFLKSTPGEFILRIKNNLTGEDIYSKEINIGSRGVVNDIINVNI